MVPLIVQTNCRGMSWMQDVVTVIIVDDDDDDDDDDDGDCQKWCGLLIAHLASSGKQKC